MKRENIATINSLLIDVGAIERFIRCTDNTQVIRLFCGRDEISISKMRQPVLFDELVAVVNRFKDNKNKELFDLGIED